MHKYGDVEIYSKLKCNKAIRTRISPHPLLFVYTPNSHNYVTTMWSEALLKEKRMRQMLQKQHILPRSKGLWVLPFYQITTGTNQQRRRVQNNPRTHQVGTHHSCHPRITPDRDLEQQRKLSREGMYTMHIKTMEQ